MCTQDRHRFTQVIHTLMHSKTDKKFPARQARPVDGVADRYLMLTYRHAATDTITIGLVPARSLLQWRRSASRPKQGHDADPLSAQQASQAVTTRPIR